MEKELVRTQYVIMKILRSKKAVNRMHSLTLAEIAEFEGRNKTNTLYKHIKILQGLKLVESGIKAERANTYFITEIGINLLKQYDNLEDKENGNEEEC